MQSLLSIYFEVDRLKSFLAPDNDMSTVPARNAAR